MRYNSTWSTNAARPRGLLSNDWKVSRAWKKRECNNRYRHVFGKMPRISVCYMRENAASRSKDSRHVGWRVARDRRWFANYLRRVARGMTMEQFRRRFPENRDVPEFLFTAQTLGIVGRLETNDIGGFAELDIAIPRDRKEGNTTITPTIVSRKNSMKNLLREIETHFFPFFSTARYIYRNI